MLVFLGLPQCKTGAFHAVLSKMGMNVVWTSLDGHFTGVEVERAGRRGEGLLSPLEQRGAEAVVELSSWVVHDLCAWPQIHSFREMFEQNPEHVYILNRRHPEELYDMCATHLGPMMDHFFAGDVGGVSRFVAQGLDRKAAFAACVDAFYRDVMSFFFERKEAKFVDFDISRDDLSKLALFLPAPLTEEEEALFASTPDFGEEGEGRRSIMS